MLIRDHKLYVVGAEGVVSAFAVGPAPHFPLVRVAVSHDPTNHRPMSLGLDGRALGALNTSGGWKLLVGTRRHIVKLNSSTLAEEDRLDFPWELAKPHHIQVAELLSSNVGKEIVFATEHGGLVFCDENLNLLQEWPEPGIVDFEVGNGFVTILSHRGVVANVSFTVHPTTGLIVASLSAASRPLPRRLLQSVATVDPALDSPSQGVPLDLDLMQVAGAAGVKTAAIALWGGDEDGLAVRTYDYTTMELRPLVANIVGSAGGRGRADITTCNEGVPSPQSDMLGDHLLALADDTIRLYDQTGNHLGAKVLFETTDPVNDYTPFGRQAHMMVVGDLVDNALTGSTGSYPDEIVVATESGALLWLHVNDIVAPGTALGSQYHLQVGAGPQSVIGMQPHTNANLSAAWAITQRGDEELLHVLDQRGGYWRIATGGNTNLWERNKDAVGARGWQEVNRDPATGDVVALEADPNWNSTRLRVAPSAAGGAFPKLIESWPWCPNDPFPLEYQNTPFYQHDNWTRRPVFAYSFDGFLIYEWGGSIVDDASGRFCWKWSSSAVDPPWGNMLEGLRFRFNTVDPVQKRWMLDALWASTEHDPGTGPGSGVPTVPFLDYLDLRSSITFQTPMTQQAIRAHMVAGNPVLVLGCPGGYVRVVQPGALAEWPGFAHVLTIGGTINDTHSTDFGYGGAALATRQRTDGTIDIWFGTMYGPTPLPTNYVSGGSLAAGEVATGTLHHGQWIPGNGLAFTQTKTLSPGMDRGGYGITGLAVANLLPEEPGEDAVDELIVCTLAGDVIVLNAETLGELWRANVPGAVGAYNSIVVADMDDDDKKELYVCGSFGIWRFIRP